MAASSFSLSEMEAELKRTQDYLTSDVYRRRKLPEESAITEVKTSRPSSPRRTQRETLADQQDSRKPLKPDAQQHHFGTDIGERLKSMAMSGRFGSSPTLKGASPPAREDRNAIVERLLREREQRLKAKLAAAAPTAAPNGFVPESGADLDSTSLPSQTAAAASAAASPTLRPPAPNDKPSPKSEEASPTRHGWVGGTVAPGSSHRARGGSDELFFASDLPPAASTMSFKPSASNNGETGDVPDIYSYVQPDPMAPLPGDPSNMGHGPPMYPDRSYPSPSRRSSRVGSPPRKSRSPYRGEEGEAELSSDSIEASGIPPRGKASRPGARSPGRHRPASGLSQEAGRSQSRPRSASVRRAGRGRPARGSSAGRSAPGRSASVGVARRRRPPSVGGGGGGAAAAGPDGGRRGRSASPPPKGARTSALREEAEREFREAHPFRPQLATQGGEGGAGAGAGALRARGASRLEELARPRAERAAEREQRRLEAERESNAACTFRPAITARARRLPGAPSGTAAGARLHRDAQERQLFQAAAKYHLEEARLGECTFRPQTNASKFAWAEGPEGYRPLPERAAEVQRGIEARRRRRLEEAEAAAAGGGAAAGVPAIDPRSDRLARAARVAGGDAAAGRGVGERLHAAAVGLEARRRERLARADAALAAEGAAEPFTSARSRRLAERNPEINRPFLERQERVGERYRARDRHRQEAKEAEAEGWFAPAVSERSAALAARRGKGAREGIRARVARLNGEAARIREDREARAREEQAKLEFQPKINGVSRALGRAAGGGRPADDLVRNFRGQHRRERALKEEEARFERECPFQPQLVTRSAASFSELFPHEGPPYGEESAADGSKYSLGLRDPARLDEKIKERHRRREEAVQRGRLAKDLEELSQCTFQPALARAGPRAAGPVVVRGLGRHLELSDLRARQAAERRERERLAFGGRAARLAAKCRARDGTTEPKPFALSDGAARRERQRREAEARHREACTFRPTLVARGGGWRRRRRRRLGGPWGGGAAARVPGGVLPGAERHAAAGLRGGGRRRRRQR